MNLIFSGPNVNIYASGNWILPHFVKILQSFIVDVKHLKKELNRGWSIFLCPFFHKSALFGQYWMLP